MNKENGSGSGKQPAAAASVGSKSEDIHMQLTAVGATEQAFPAWVESFASAVSAYVPPSRAPTVSGELAAGETEIRGNLLAKSGVIAKIKAELVLAYVRGRCQENGSNTDNEKNWEQVALKCRQQLQWPTSSSGPNKLFHGNKKSPVPRLKMPAEDVVENYYKSFEWVLRQSATGYVRVSNTGKYYPLVLREPIITTHKQDIEIVLQGLAAVIPICDFVIQRCPAYFLLAAPPLTRRQGLASSTIARTLAAAIETAARKNPSYYEKFVLTLSNIVCVSALRPLCDGPHTKENFEQNAKQILAASIARTEQLLALCTVFLCDEHMLPPRTAESAQDRDLFERHVAVADRSGLQSLLSYSLLTVRAVRKEISAGTDVNFNWRRSEEVTTPETRFSKSPNRGKIAFAAMPVPAEFCFNNHVVPSRTPLAQLPMFADVLDKYALASDMTVADIFDIWNVSARSMSNKDIAEHLILLMVDPLSIHLEKEVPEQYFQPFSELAAGPSDAMPLSS